MRRVKARRTRRVRWLNRVRTSISLIPKAPRRSSSRSSTDTTTSPRCSSKRAPIPNIADIKGMTPLYAAVDMHTIGDTFGRPYPPQDGDRRQSRRARVLIKGGANVNARLKAPILKRVYNAGDNRLGEGATPFMRAARKCDVEMMRLLCRRC